MGAGSKNSFQHAHFTQINHKQSTIGINSYLQMCLNDENDISDVTIEKTRKEPFKIFPPSKKNFLGP